jgi:short subunit dehydrogenase-like uncharacterized protein
LPLIVADANDQASLEAMAARASVVISTAGPYQLYGSGLVAACAKTGTDYVDLTGESHWIAAMMAAHEAQAKKSGARIVFSCGFDSIPFDLGVWFAQEAARKKFGAYVPRVRGRIRGLKGGLSGGTLASGQATMAAARKDSTIGKTLANPFALTPGFEGPAQPDGDTPYEDKVTGSWVGPFMMAGINTKAVHRPSRRRRRALAALISARRECPNRARGQRQKSATPAGTTSCSSPKPLTDAPCVLRSRATEIRAMARHPRFSPNPRSRWPSTCRAR